MCRNKRWWVLATVAVVAVAAGAKVWKGRVTPEKLAAGKTLFEHEWTANDPLAGGDGLGPVFNARSCVACHFQGGVGGGGPNKHNVKAFEVVPDQTRRRVTGGVVHKFASFETLLETDDRVRELFPIIPGGTRLIGGCSVQVADFNPVLFSEINTPALFGLGLIDQISDLSIQANGAKRTFNSISKNLDGDLKTAPVGRVRGVRGSVGKFGWKGQFSKLEDFVAAACAVELGLSNPHRFQDLPREHVPDESAELDMTSEQLHELVSFVAALPAPREVIPTGSKARETAAHGKVLFSEIGCANCHTPDMGGVVGVYSDFRLYRIESTDPRGAYARIENEFEMPFNHPKPNEWKTPPLWGVADSAPYFHDGASPTLAAAIARHGLSARQSRQAFEDLQDADRMAVIAFLKTLRAPQPKIVDLASNTL